MATWYLMNNVLVGTIRYYAGRYIDDAQFDTTQLLACGGKLAASSTSGLAAASELVTKLRRNGSDPSTFESIMVAALNAAQTADDAAHDVVGAEAAHTHAVANTSEFIQLGDPDAPSATAIHAGFAGNDASNDFPGPFTNPDVPRNATVTFAAGWDGGDVTVVGTARDDTALQEVFTAAAGSTVAGVEIFKTIVSATKGAVGAAADAASIGSGQKLGLPNGKTMTGTRGACLVDGVAEAGTWDSTRSAVTPTTAPDGSKLFDVIVNLSHASAAGSSHTHVLS